MFHGSVVHPEIFIEPEDLAMGECEAQIPYAQRANSRNVRIERLPC